MGDLALLLSGVYRWVGDLTHHSSDGLQQDQAVVQPWLLQLLQLAGGKLPPIGKFRQGQLQLGDG